jgi:hypothetical protein
MPRLAPVGRGPGRSETRNGTRLAPRGISFVLDVAIPSARRQTQDDCGNPCADPPLGRRKPGWGAPKVHLELQKLGLVVSERTVDRYLRRVRRRHDPGQKWLTFLANHREVIAAFDFFTVPTVTFKLLYCFFIIEHARRKILHFNVTRHPTADWVVQQLRESSPEAGRYCYVILDRDAKFDADVIAFLKATGLEPKRTPAFDRPARMESRNGGWEVAGESYWTM